MLGSFFDALKMHTCYVDCKTTVWTRGPNHSFWASGLPTQHRSNLGNSSTRNCWLECGEPAGFRGSCLIRLLFELANFHKSWFWGRFFVSFKRPNFGHVNVKTGTVSVHLRTPNHLLSSPCHDGLKTHGNASVIIIPPIENNFYSNPFVFTFIMFMCI